MENKTKLRERLADEEIVKFKEQILELLDDCKEKTLSSAARKVGVSPTKTYQWLKTDDNFRDQVKQARKVLGDKLIEELLSVSPDAKMPAVTAKIFLIKGFHPEFRDSYKVVEFKDERAIALLEELRQLGKEEPKPEPENPFNETIERVNMADNGEQTAD